MPTHACAPLAMIVAGVLLAAGPALAADPKVRIWTPTPVASAPEHLDAVDDTLRPVAVTVKIVFYRPNYRLRAYKRALGQLYPGYIGRPGGQLYAF